ncbi:MAG TPA: hypothetical protein PLW65_04560 [Pseudomonadota bacterium]|nr:hypothetical protein [Pseudomonadota bacterium]
MKKDIGLRGASRRDFVRGVFTASAALGLGPTRALDMLEKMGGSALAQAAVNRSLMVNLILGNGAMSRATQLVAVPNAIKTFDPANTALNPMTTGAPISSRFKQLTLPSGNPYYGRIIDGKAFGEKKPWTVFVSGQSQAHSNFPAFNGNVTTVAMNGNVSMLSAAAQLQTSLHSLVPAIGIQRGGQSPNYNPASPGSPALSAVTDQNAMVGLFASAASQLMNRLGDKAHQDLYSQYYTALLGLTRWAGRPTYSTSAKDAQTALSLVVQNLGTQLRVQPGQAATWAGPLVATDNRMQPVVETLIVTANAFKLGLTPHVTFGGFFDDPHGAFAGQPDDLFDGLGRSLESFQAYLDTIPDPVVSGKNLGDRLVMTMSGDTIKNPHQRSGWPDGAPGGANLLYVQGAGKLPGGFFGDIMQNARMNWDPVTGALSGTTPTAACTSAACGAVLYAVTGGSTDDVRQYYSAPLGNIIIKPGTT